MASPETAVLQALSADLATRVSADLRDRPDLLERLARLEILATLDVLAWLVNPDHRDRVERLDRPDQLETRAPQVTR